MVNWTPIGIALLIIGILMIIAAAVLFYVYRLQINQSKWWIWLIGGFGLLFIILGIVALVVGNKPSTIAVPGYIPNNTMGDSYFVTPDNRTVVTKGLTSAEVLSYQPIDILSV